jgi:hypothetical protein
MRKTITLARFSKFVVYAAHSGMRFGAKIEAVAT